jgi:uncharacterized membrane protein
MSRWVNKVLIALSVIGVLDSIYMTIYKLTNNNSMCLGSGDCSTVNASRYAEVNGIPVALIGVVGYLAILAVLVLEGRGGGFFKENGSLLVFGLSLTGFLFTVWLIYVEIALIKAICPFCLVSQITMTLIFLLSTYRLVRQS